MRKFGRKISFDKGKIVILMVGVVGMTAVVILGLLSVARANNPLTSIKHLVDAHDENAAGDCIVSNGIEWGNVKLDSLQMTITHMGSGCTYTESNGLSSTINSRYVRNFLGNGYGVACKEPSYYKLGETWELSVAAYRSKNKKPVFQSTKTLTLDECAGPPWWEQVN